MVDPKKTEEVEEYPTVRPSEGPSYSAILQEQDVARRQREIRQKLLQDLAKPEFNDGRKPNAVVAHIGRGALSGGDIPVLGNVLRQIGDVETLNLLSFAKVM